MQNEYKDKRNRQLKREFRDFVEALLDEGDDGWKEFFKPTLVQTFTELGMQGRRKFTVHLIYLAFKGDTPFLGCSTLIEPIYVPDICERIAQDEPNFWCLFDTWGGLKICGAKDRKVRAPQSVTVDTLSIINA